MDAKLKHWIDKIAKTDRILAALLRGLVGTTIDVDVTTFIWHSEFHKEQARRKEAEIRRHLGSMSGNVIVHKVLSEVAADDPMLSEALTLGAKVSFLRD